MHNIYTDCWCKVVTKLDIRSLFIAEGWVHCNQARYCWLREAGLDEDWAVTAVGLGSSAWLQANEVSNKITVYKIITPNIHWNPSECMLQTKHVYIKSTTSIQFPEWYTYVRNLTKYFMWLKYVQIAERTSLLIDSISVSKVNILSYLRHQQSQAR